MDSLFKLKDSLSVTSILVSKETCVPANLDFDEIVDHAFKQLSNRSVKRSDYFYIIAKYIHNYSCAQINSIIERLPSFFDAATNDKLEEDALLYLFEELLIHGSSEVKDLLKKLLTKLVNSLSKNISKYPESHIGFKALQLLAKSSLRPEVSPLSKQVCPACLAAVDYSGNREQLATTFALFASMENPENWSTHFNDIAVEGHLLMMTLGIDDPAAKPGVKTVVPSSILPAMKDIKSSPLRAVYLMDRFLSVCELLKKMMICGCATGAVSLNLTALASLLPWLFEVKPSYDASDRNNYIQENSGFAFADIALVVSKMKIGLIQVMTQLYSLNPPSLLMFAQALFRPLIQLSSQTEIAKVPSLKLALIKALSVAARCFPSLTSTEMEGRTVHLLSWLEQEVDRVTALTSLVSFHAEVATSSTAKTASSASASDADSTELLLALIAGCDQVLLHCAASLGSKVRQGFEDVVGRVLLCLSKGLVYPQYADRKMHRSSEHCESLRQSPELQAAFLRLAATEVLCPSSRIGQGSSNVSLLKRVAEMALSHPITSGEAAKALLIICSMQHPSTVALPAIAPVELGMGYIQKVNDVEEKRKEQLKKAVPAPAPAPVASVVNVTVSVPIETKTVATNSTVAAGVAQAEEEQKLSLKRGRDNETTDEPVSSAVASDSGAAEAKKARSSSPETRRAPLYDDNDDEDLPDLE